jgi:hypothetical protein
MILDIGGTLGAVKYFGRRASRVFAFLLLDNCFALQLFMAELSPGAQAVKNAVLALYTDRNVRSMAWPLDKPVVAAALQALADQVAPNEPNYIRIRRSQFPRQEIIRAKILAIATELEGEQ